MGGLFDINSKFMQFLYKAADLILLNVLTLVCCIPIVTIGPAFSAMHYVLLRIYRNEGSGLLRDFFHSFVGNLKQGIVLTVGYLLYFLLLLLDYQLASRTETGILRIVLYAVPFLALIGGLSLSWVFALLSRYTNTVWGTVKTTFAACVAHPIRSLAMMALTILPYLLLALSPAMVPVFLLFAVSLSAFLRVMLYDPVFKKLETPKEEKAD